MKIICAGLYKTGTKSLATALQILGFSVHDFPEHLKYHHNEYDQAFSTGNMPNFALMYSKVDAVTDIPACLFWKELKETFPDAKVILMERDNVDDWVKSYLRTDKIYQEMMLKPWNLFGLMLTPSGRRIVRIFKGITDKMEIGQDPAKCYLRHNARVKDSIPRDDLLVYNVKQGWKPLCDFLGIDVPDIPFPKVNVKSSLVGGLFYSNIFTTVQYELICGTLILVMFAALILFVMTYS